MRVVAHLVEAQNWGKNYSDLMNFLMSNVFTTGASFMSERLFLGEVFVQENCKPNFSVVRCFLCGLPHVELHCGSQSQAEIYMPCPL